MAWWRAGSKDAERWFGPEATREDAIAAGRADEFGGESFVVMEAEQQPWRFDCFDRLDEFFDEANEELADGEGDPASVDAGIATVRGGLSSALREHLEDALASWIREHGKATAWALNFTGSPHFVAAEDDPIVSVEAGAA